MAPTPQAKDEASFPPIDSSASEIRLIELHPGPPTSPIICSYRVISLSGPHRPYEALSYTWVDPNLPKQELITIESTQTPVTANLYHALRTLRLTDDKRRYLWVDAVCINQRDDREKTAQVAMMRRIYSDCEQCAIWLGPLDDNVAVHHARDALEGVAWMAGEVPRPAWLDDDNDERYMDACRALKAMMARGWWSRIWTVQEAILPPRAVVYWGPCEIAWGTMHCVSERFFGKREELVARHGGLRDCDDADGLLEMLWQFHGLQFTKNAPPLDVLHRWRSRNATDPRDKVYGLAGVQRDMRLPSLRECDYGIDVRTLFARVTVELIEDCGTLQPLIGRRGEAHTVEGLPSWAIDWNKSDDTEKARMDFFTYYRLWYEYSRVNCAADAGVYGVGDGLKMLDDKTLLLCGRYVDRIVMLENLEDTRGTPRDTSSDLELLLSAGNALSGNERWSQLISRFETQFPGKLPGKLPRDLGWMENLMMTVPGKLEDNLKFCIDSVVSNGALFVTEQGRLGVGHWNNEPGDEVWIVGGSPWPLVLAPGDPPEPLYMTFRGECFVHGIMSGEAPGENREFWLR